MLNHVLTAIDFTAGTTRLLGRLRTLHKLGATQATLMHVLSTRYPAAPSETHRASYEERLGKLAAELGASGIKAKTKVATGEPGYELVRAANELNVDLILAGRSGNQRWRELFLGSTALDLARLTDRPLWLEPLDEDSDDIPLSVPRCILLATDGSDAAQAAEVMFVQLIPNAQRAIALHVVPGRDGESGKERETADARQSLADLKRRAADIETIIQSGDPTVEIASVAERENADLIVVGKRGRSQIRALLLGSTAEALCRRSRRPVVLVPGR